jgi:hypothetical protein
MDAERVMPGTAPSRNGLPEFRPYVYRGTGEDTLTPPRFGPAPRKGGPRGRPSKDGRCGGCGYMRGSASCRAECG